MFARSLTSHAVTGVLRRLVKPLLFRTGVDPETLRKQVLAVSGRFASMPRDIRVNSGRLEGIPVSWIYNEKSSADFVILYLHGGGFVLPELKVHLAFCGYLARKTAATVILPSYRLAPEHPFPAAPEDCLATYRWLLQRGYAAERIIIAGDSAGGNLTLATALAARREGLPLPRGLVMLSPVLRFEETDTGSHRDNLESEAMLSRQAIEYFFNAYIPEDVLLSDPRLSPLLEDFSGLPPMRLYAGSAEILRDDSLLAVEKAREAGVDAEVMIGEGMPHVWPLLDILPESRPAREDVVLFINNRWRSLRSPSRAVMR
jgi:acetyl esterase/lipase